jgi:superfamily I DNA/RNA helicase
MQEASLVADKYKKAEYERQLYVDAVLNSKSRKKVVVAGPGTGKTFLFKKILLGKKNTLTLTFINSLVEDLSLQLYGISDVRTLHSFARGILKQLTNKDIKVFPKLSELIKDDAKILIGRDIDFDKLFHNRDDSNLDINLFEKRREYYDYYGYSDIVFEAVKYFEQNKENIPSFGHIVVDEFQDFNLLEVSLIDLLAEKSPILLAGDDDQALYDFKSASTRHIRERHREERPDYESFSLPFCARSTRVIVDAANDVISAARKFGFLRSRIDKPYKYFDHREKDAESGMYPKIGYTQLFAKQIPWFIESKIGNMAGDLKDTFAVLIISPTTVQTRSIAEALKGKGFANVQYQDKRAGEEPSLLDGLKLLMEHPRGNLGWRIVSGTFLSEKDFQSLLRETGKADPKSICELINPRVKREVSKILRILRSLNKNKVVDEAELDLVFKRIKLNPYEMSSETLKYDINSSSLLMGDPGIRKIPIKCTTIQSSKGLSGDLVFITHFDDRYFVRDRDKRKITDYDICNFVVPLTRAEKKVYLISSVREDPTFLAWINKDRIERL